MNTVGHRKCGIKLLCVHVGFGVKWQGQPNVIMGLVLEA